MHEGVCVWRERESSNLLRILVAPQAGKNKKKKNEEAVDDHRSDFLWGGLVV